MFMLQSGHISVKWGFDNFIFAYYKPYVTQHDDILAFYGFLVIMAIYFLAGYNRLLVLLSDAGEISIDTEALGWKLLVDIVMVLIVSEVIFGMILGSIETYQLCTRGAVRKRVFCTTYVLSIGFLTDVHLIFSHRVLSGPYQMLLILYM